MTPLRDTPLQNQSDPPLSFRTAQSLWAESALILKRSGPTASVYVCVCVPASKHVFHQDTEEDQGTYTSNEQSPYNKFQSLYLTMVAENNTTL